MRLADFGLWVLSLGPKDPDDKQMERELIALWRKAKTEAK